MSEKRTCPSCGAEISAGAPMGLCEACLWKVSTENEAPEASKDNSQKSTISISPPLTEKPGDRIGPYKLLQQIGKGGMGTVWMAERTEPFQHRVALKVINPGMDSGQVLARFEAERQALALMDHPNI